jgi:hypothetical protein
MRKTLFIAGIIALIATGVAIIASTLLDTSLFDAKDIVFVYKGTPVGSLRFSGKVNIFHIDTRTLAQYIKKHAPCAKDIKISRQFPNKLIAHMEFYDPYAQVQISGRYYLVGEKIIDYPLSRPWNNFVLVTLEKSSVTGIHDTAIEPMLKEANAIIRLTRRMKVPCNKITLFEGTKKFVCRFQNNVEVTFANENFL